MVKCPKLARNSWVIVPVNLSVLTHKIPGMAYLDHQFDMVKNYLRDKALGLRIFQRCLTKAGRPTWNVGSSQIDKEE